MTDVEKFASMLRGMLILKEAHVSMLVETSQHSEESKERGLEVVSALFGEVHKALDATVRMYGQDTIATNTVAPEGIQ